MSKIDNRMRLFQICDSTFPIGTFNHSFGLENYIVDLKVKKAPDFAAWLHSFMKSQYLYGEGLSIKLVYEAIGDKDLTKEDDLQDVLAKLKHMDNIITCSAIARETRNAGRLVAKQMWNILPLLGEVNSLLALYGEAINSNQVQGNPALLFALYAYQENIPWQEAFQMYGYSLASTMVQNAVRSVPLGQKDGQCILRQCMGELESYVDVVAKLDEDYLGATVPGIEMAQIRHEVQLARLFMS